jgi:urease accessory protein
VAAANALRAALRHEVPSVVTIDRELVALKTAPELRRASTDTGRRLLDEVAAHQDAPTLEAFRGEVHAGRSPGTHPVVLGVVASTFDVDPVTVAAVVMQGTANAVLQAAMRLFPVSHRDVQGCLHRWRPRIAALAQTAATSGAALQSFHPLQDIASMQHEAASVRLFAS